ncbi:MAG: alpha-amylase family glycosyl hydrolase, partial [Caulobacteraceae bacterium]|nr:alpha-amylase family glycosyl hydrolase [Caulobacteraceae bacterium]
SFAAHAPEGWPAWAFSNHDVARAVSRWGGSEAPPAFARLLLVLLGCLRGTVFLYQGEELGLPEAEVPRPEDRPDASMESLPVGKVLGTLKEIFFADVGLSNLQNTREDPALFDGGNLVSPGYMLRRANYVLARSVKLGPWIHVESDVRLHGLISDGDLLETRAIVVANEEKNGHLIVTLDFTVACRERLAMSGRHWAIYAPRQVRELG